MLMQGSGYQYTNVIGTIYQRNTDYTFSLAGLTPNYISNYNTFLYIWDIPGVSFHSFGLSRRYIVTVNVPTGYTPSYDPTSGNYYIPGTVTIANSPYACINTTYSINFAVPANFPNRSAPGTLMGQAAGLDGVGGISGVDEASGVGGLRVFPNPAVDVLSIRPGKAMGKDGYIEIFTSAGVRMKVLRAPEASGSGTLQVNVVDLANGLYFVAVHSKNGVYRSKFLVAR